MRRALWSSIVFTALLAGCSVGTIDAADYRQDCVVDEDCVAIAPGEACAPCRCESAAIHVDDFDAFRADLDAQVCLDPLLPFAPDCLCAGGVAVCDAGRCVVELLP